MQKKISSREFFYRILGFKGEKEIWCIKLRFVVFFLGFCGFSGILSFFRIRLPTTSWRAAQFINLAEKIQSPDFFHRLRCKKDCIAHIRYICFPKCAFFKSAFLQKWQAPFLADLCFLRAKNISGVDIWFLCGLHFYLSKCNRKIWITLVVKNAKVRFFRIPEICLFFWPLWYPLGGPIL